MFMAINRFLFCFLVLCCAWSGLRHLGVGAEDDKSAGTVDRAILIADGKLELTAPGTWNRREPKISIVEHEFAIPAAEGDKVDGRMTIMASGGSIEDNIDRWVGQFSQPDGRSTKDKAKVKRREIAGMKVHLVDLSGTFKDQRVPFAPAIERARMLAAIVETTNGGNYFFKFYGPERTVAANEKEFNTMLEGIKKK